ncbi:MAG: alpha/beta fold hydrolase, partial [Acidobacteria bacterium]|nr:alpha/beta fold hydrolase [Acidobacteriota bacterium]
MPRRLLVAYLLLLALSHGVRLARGTPPPAGDVFLAPVEVAGHASAPGAPAEVAIAYSDRGSGSAVVMLHGSPGSHHDFDRLEAEVATEHRVIAPDLPGFGRSSHDVPDYSIRAHARYVLDLLDGLGIEKFHVLGFSMGGGVALELTDLAPERVLSVSMVSAIGVQELELLGDYHLNHGLHALQLAGLWLLREATPHFGWLDDSVLDVAYARNFYDTDQRPLRGFLEAWNGPLLIVHGEHDVLVPVAAAREHHRLVPQSELILLDRNHFFVFSAPPILTDPLLTFLRRVDEGTAETRAEVPAPLREAAQRPFDPASIPPVEGFPLVVLFLLIAAATLVTEDLTCIATGLMIGAGRLGFFTGTLACVVGIFIGDLLLYLAGRWLGRPALRRRPLRWFIGPEDITRASQWFTKRGPLVILLSRFLPGTRFATYVAAGLLRTHFWRFAAYFLLAVLLWTPMLVGAAAWLGPRVQAGLATFGRGVWVLVVAVLLILLLVRLVVGLATHRGRRLARGRLRRWLRWEYWPRWAFYPPVVAYIVGLAIKYRRPTLFTAANPAIPASGFVGESKSAILEGLDGSADLVARWTLLDPETPLDERRAKLRSFLEEHGLDLPVVLKPDAGERGSGVRIAGTWEEIDEALARQEELLIAQRYVRGPEFGVFYLRLPDEPSGRVFSITHKVLPEVVGDGRRSLETLILDDDRLVPMAEHYFRARAAELDRVLEPGERRRLIDVGTHCRGSLFYDANDLAGPGLLAALDGISRRFPGFYFG